MSNKIDINKSLEELINSINENIIKYTSDKTSILNDIDTALKMFINNYNKDLNYNTTPFSKICKSVISLDNKYKSLLLNYLRTYTTIKSVDTTFLKLTTSEYICKKDSSNKIKKFIVVKYLENFNDSVKWYDKIEKESTTIKKEKSIKQLNNSLNTCINSLLLASDESFKYFDIVKTIEYLQNIVKNNENKINN